MNITSRHRKFLEKYAKKNLKDPESLTSKGLKETELGLLLASFGLHFPISSGFRILFQLEDLNGVSALASTLSIFYLTCLLI